MNNLSVSEHEIQEAKRQFICGLGIHADEIITRMCDTDGRYSIKLALMARVLAQPCATYRERLIAFSRDNFIFTPISQRLPGRCVTPTEVMMSNSDVLYEPSQILHLAATLPPDDVLESLGNNGYLTPMPPSATGWFVTSLFAGVITPIDDYERIVTVEESRWILETYHRVHGNWLIGKSVRLRTSSRDGDYPAELTIHDGRLISVKGRDHIRPNDNYTTMFIRTNW